MFTQFESTTDAVLRYIELWSFKSNPHSIPLGVKKTHGGKTDSRGRHLAIETELFLLMTVFPKSETEEWYLLTINQATNLMPKDRCKFMQEKTKKRWTEKQFESYSHQAYRDLRWRLEEKGWIKEYDFSRELLNASGL